MPTITLLGDSIFDNAGYTRGEPDVVTHLSRMLPAGWSAVLRAVDGATTTSVHAQLSRIPAATTHVALAIGGNDALANLDLLSTRVASTAEALTLFGSRLAPFEAAYRRVITAVRGLGYPTTVCTIYNGALEPDRAPIARVALTLFNDAILRTAFEFGVDAIELRLVCTEPEDYANPIEPSGTGGKKIAAAIAAAAGVFGEDAPSRVFLHTRASGRVY